MYTNAYSLNRIGELDKRNLPVAPGSQRGSLRQAETCHEKASPTKLDWLDTTPAWRGFGRLRP